MFRGCTNLTTAPALPATTLAQYCYREMFRGCTNLTTAPELSATALANYCCYKMFADCYNLIQAPALPATTLANSCYSHMFDNCTRLTQTPELPATTLATYCYEYMFAGCASLTQAPTLPAATLANYCYRYMFYNCRRIRLSETQTDDYTTEYHIPTSETGETVTGAFNDMFASTGGTFQGTPNINTTYYMNTNILKIHTLQVNGKPLNMVNGKKVKNFTYKNITYWVD